MSDDEEFSDSEKNNDDAYSDTNFKEKQFSQGRKPRISISLAQKVSTIIQSAEKSKRNPSKYSKKRTRFLAEKTERSPPDIDSDSSPQSTVSQKKMKSSSDREVTPVRE